MPSEISGTAETTVFKFYTLVGRVKY